MYSTSDMTEEWAFEMNSHNFCAWCGVPVLGALNVRCDALEAFACGIERSTHGSGKQRRSAMAGNGFSNYFERVGSGVHNVAGAGAMDVNINESRRHRVLRKIQFLRAGGRNDLFTPAN